MGISDLRLASPYRSARVGLGMLVFGFCLLCARPGARADVDRYAGLQLAPSVHLGVAGRVFSGGAGAELSFTKWLLVELQLSGLTRAEPDVPGSVRTSLGLYSRIGGSTHAFVYGTGVSYNTRLECPKYCTLFATLYGPEESRTALDLWTADVGGGYEARLASRLFFRGIARFEIPLYAGEFGTRDYGPEFSPIESDRRGYGYLLRLSVYLTVGYAFPL
jgi:hypothetical protein